MKCDVCFDGREFFGHGFCGRIPSQCLSGAVVHQSGDVVQGGLTEIAQLRPFREELAQQSVGVFVRAALPGGVGIAEPDVDLQASRQFGMAGHLRAAIIGHGSAQGHRQPFHLSRESFKGGSGGATLIYQKGLEANILVV